MPKQKIRINLQSDPASLHPHLGIDLICRSLQKAVFEGLTRTNLEGKLELAACDSYTLSPDGLTYTFELKKQHWSNGQEVTSFDFINAWKRAIAKDSNCLRADLFYLIKNAKSVKSGKLPMEEVGFYAPNPKTIVVTLEHPAPFFLDLLSNPLFFPIYEEAPLTTFNGPFIVQKWEHDKRLVLTSNPHYWDRAKVGLKEIEFFMVRDPATAILMYEKGEIDWIGGPFIMLPLDAIPRFEKSPEFHSKELKGVYWISLNNNHFPLNSAKIRKALSYAIPRQEISSKLLQGETPTISIIPTSLRKGAMIAEGDLEKAKRLFEEGLSELKITKAEFPALQLTHSDIPGQKSLIEAIASLWEKHLGIHCDIKGSEWNVFFSNLGSRQYQIAGCIWYFLYNDPIYSLSFFKDLENRYNAPGWTNGEYKKLIALAEEEQDLDKRAKYIADAETIFLNEMPVIPLYVVHAKYLVKECVHNIFVSDLGHVDFKWAHVDEHALSR